MQRFSPLPLPRMREQRLVVEDLPDEVLVYDLDRHQAHCLNRAAGLVWRHCDGQTTAAEIARRVRAELDRPFSEDLVWLAVRDLQGRHLLEAPVALPPRLTGLSRRRMMRNLGLAAAVALPVIVSLVSPTPAQASTCIQTGGVCNGSIACCSLLPCDITNHCP